MAKGRPKYVVTAEHTDLVRKMAIAGIAQEQMACVLGISAETLVKYYDEILKNEKAKTIAEIAGGVVNRAKAGDNACAFFYLKTQARWRETEHVEESTKKPEEIRIVVLDKPAR